MRNITAGAIGGLAAGMILSGAKALGCEERLAPEILADRAQDWLDPDFDTRRQLGPQGVELLERLNSLAASAVFGGAYGALRPATRLIPPLISGALLGWGLYAVAVGKAVPAIGAAREEDADGELSMQRLGLHLLFGVVTALATEAMTPPRRGGAGAG